MSRVKKSIWNLAIIIIMIFILRNTFNLHLTPLAAFEKTEGERHYGPTKIHYLENYNKGKIIIGTYDNRVTFSILNRQLYLFWICQHHDNNLVIQNNPFQYTWYQSDDYLILYGIKQEPNIERVELYLNNGDIYEITEFHDNLFLIMNKHDPKDFWNLINVIGYDKYDTVVYEDIKF